ncbi:MAG TPA: hypothetical protein VFW92_05965, partial [Candidatus Limnocylindrales bacterium]|nr:hypothetical protein [Candidatus Limnocylindrales bacterium]
MVGSTDPRSARRLRRIRFALLALGGLLLGHTAVYAVAFGDGSAFGQQMRLGGHDGYWPAFAGAALAGLVVLAVDGLLGLLRAWRGARPSAFGGARNSPLGVTRRSPLRIARTPAVEPTADGRSAPDYLTEFLDLWGPLFIVVGAAFLVQENAESLIVHGQLPLLGVFTAH